MAMLALRALLWCCASQSRPRWSTAPIVQAFGILSFDIAMRAIGVQGSESRTRVVYFKFTDP